MVTIEDLKKEQPDIYNAIIEQGRMAEAQRIKDVKAQSLPGHEKLINQLIEDGKTTGYEAAIKVLAAEREILNQRKANLEDDAPSPVKHVDLESSQAKNSMSFEDKCRAKWDKDGELRDEFQFNETDKEQAFKDFVNYERKLADGHIKVLRGGK